MVSNPKYKTSNRSALIGRWEEVDPLELIPAACQTRKHPAHKARTLLASIRANGIITPIIVNSANVIVDGILRVEQALKLGLRSVPVVRVEHLSEAELRSYAIAANRMPATVRWDMDALRLELEEIRAADVTLDLGLTGFSIGEIDRIFGNHLVAEYDDLDEDTENPGDPGPGRAMRGDLWELGSHRVLCGDATDAAVVSRLMGSETARAAFTDPPYNVRINGHVSGSGQHSEFPMASGEMSTGEFTTFLEVALANLADVLVDGGIAFVCMDHAHMGELIAAGDRAFDRRLNICVWDKGQGGMGSLYRSQHEFIAVFKKGEAPHCNNVELGKNGRNRTNVWSFPGLVGFSKSRAKTLALHPTVKPVALIAEAILDVTAMGDLVLDSFGGSGSTLIAAERTGRRARLIELDPVYVDRTLARWERLTDRAAVLLERSGDPPDDPLPLPDNPAVSPTERI